MFREITTTNSDTPDASTQQSHTFRLEVLGVLEAPPKVSSKVRALVHDSLNPWRRTVSAHDGSKFQAISKRGEKFGELIR